MKASMAAMATALVLSGCGTATGDRGLSGAGIGAGIGVIGGPPGMVVGGAVVVRERGLLTTTARVGTGRRRLLTVEEAARWRPE